MLTDAASVKRDHFSSCLHFPFHLPHSPLPLTSLMSNCVHDVLERKTWLMLENVHRARGPAAPPPPPSLWAFCVQVWLCVRLFLSLGDSPDAFVCVCVCVWRKHPFLPGCTRLHFYIFSSFTGNSGASARCVFKLFNHFSCLSVKDWEYSSKCWCVFVGIAVNTGTHCSFKVFVLDWFVRARREEGDEAVGVGACEVSVFFQGWPALQRLTLCPSHSYTQTSNTQNCGPHIFHAVLYIHRPYSHINMFKHHCFASFLRDYCLYFFHASAHMHAHARRTPGAAAWLKSSDEVVGAESNPGRSAQHWQAKRSVKIRMEKKALLGGGSPPVSIATVMPLWPHCITLVASLPPLGLLHCLQCFGVFLLWAVADSCRSMPPHIQTSLHLWEILCTNHRVGHTSPPRKGFSISASGRQMTRHKHGS